MKRLVVVTGAFGFIGRHVCQVLASQPDVCVRGIGHGNWSREEAAGWGLSDWSSTDISFDSLANTMRGEQPEAVIHCAGGGSVAFSYERPHEDYLRTVATVTQLLEQLRLSKFHQTRVVLASSAAVYGDQGDVDLSESAASSPISPYAFHKRAAEEACTMYSRFFDQRISIVRLFSVYGEGLRKQLLWDAANKLTRSDVGQFFGTGRELRDWIHVSDAASLICCAALSPQGKLEIFNGAGTQATTGQVLHMLRAGLGNGPQPTFSGETHTGNPRRLTADTSHARRQLAWAPTVNLTDGIRRYCDWFKATHG